MKVAQSPPTLCNPRLWAARLLCPWNSPGQNTGVGSCSFLQGFSSPGDFPNPGIKSRSPALLGGSLLSEPPGKPKNTGVGSLTLLQGIFLTQEWNWGLLHCRWIFFTSRATGKPQNVVWYHLYVGSIKHNKLMTITTRKRTHRLVELRLCEGTYINRMAS